MVRKRTTGTNSGGNLPGVNRSSAHVDDHRRIKDGSGKSPARSADGPTDAPALVPDDHPPAAPVDTNVMAENPPPCPSARAPFMTLRRLLTAAAVALSSIVWTPTRAALAPPPAPADTDPKLRDAWSAATVRHLVRQVRPERPARARRWRAPGARPPPRPRRPRGRRRPPHPHSTKASPSTTPGSPASASRATWAAAATATPSSTPAAPAAGTDSARSKSGSPDRSCGRPTASVGRVGAP